MRLGLAPGEESRRTSQAASATSCAARSLGDRHVQLRFIEVRRAATLEKRVPRPEILENRIFAVSGPSHPWMAVVLRCALPTLERSASLSTCSLARSTGGLRVWLNPRGGQGQTNSAPASRPGGVSRQPLTRSQLSESGRRATYKFHDTGEARRLEMPTLMMLLCASIRAPWIRFLPLRLWPPRL